MLYLFASIIFTALTYSIFKAFGKYKVDALPAIVFNYFFRVIIGFSLDPLHIIGYVRNSPIPLLWLAIGTGLSFILIFYLVSVATKTLGVTSTTIIARMSMVIPASFSIIYYHDDVGIAKVIGIILAIVAIYFTVYQKNNKQESNPSKKNAYLKLIPIFLFIGSGLADTFLKISQTGYMPNGPDFVFIDVLYAASSLAGILALVLSRTPVKVVFKKANLVWGLILGIVNYIALYLFLLALSSGGMDGSKVFPINSVGIVLFSTVFAIVFYKEKLNRTKIIGLLLSITAIILITRA